MGSVLIIRDSSASVSVRLASPGTGKAAGSVGHRNSRRHKKHPSLIPVHSFLLTQNSRIHTRGQCFIGQTSLYRKVKVTRSSLWAKNTRVLCFSAVIINRRQMGLTLFWGEKWDPVWSITNQISTRRFHFHSCINHGMGDDVLLWNESPMLHATSLLGSKVCDSAGWYKIGRYNDSYSLYNASHFISTYATYPCYFIHIWPQYRLLSYLFRRKLVSFKCWHPTYFKINLLVH